MSKVFTRNNVLHGSFLEAIPKKQIMYLEGRAWQQRLRVKGRQNPYYYSVKKNTNEKIINFFNVLKSYEALCDDMTKEKQKLRGRNTQ